MIKITYLDHSGFLVETKDCAIMFDYSNGAIPELAIDTRLYVFVSHSHRDHFNPDIFKLQERYPHVVYILSYDVKTANAGSVYRFAPEESFSFPHFDLKTTDSTDEGVSFLLTLHDGQTIFHAGDLNWWTWIGEDTEEDARIMEQRFKKEVNRLAGIPIDIAFLPLDPRQQDRYFWGFDYFMRRLDISLAFPMHFWGNDKIIDRLLASEHSQGYRDRISVLRKSGDTYP